jgi:hypothetical protein
MCFVHILWRCFDLYEIVMYPVRFPERQLSSDERSATNLRYLFAANTIKTCIDMEMKAIGGQICRSVRSALRQSSGQLAPSRAAFRN